MVLQNFTISNVVFMFPCCGVAYSVSLVHNLFCLNSWCQFDLWFACAVYVNVVMFGSTMTSSTVDLIHNSLLQCNRVLVRPLFGSLWLVFVSTVHLSFYLCSIKKTVCFLTTVLFQLAAFSIKKSDSFYGFLLHV